MSNSNPENLQKLKLFSAAVLGHFVVTYGLAFAQMIMLAKWPSYSIQEPNSAYILKAYFLEPALSLLIAPSRLVLPLPESPTYLATATYIGFSSGVFGGLGVLLRKIKALSVSA